MFATKASVTRLRLAALLAAAAMIAAACGGGTEVTAGVAPTGDGSGDVGSEDGGAVGDAESRVGEDTAEEALPGDEDPAEESPEVRDPHGDEIADPDEPADSVEPDAVALREVPGVVELEQDLPQASVECVIDGLVADRELALAVITADSDDLLDLEPAQAEAVIDLTLTCVDDHTLAELIRSGFEEEGFSLPAEVSACFAGEFDTVAERRALLEMGMAGDVEPAPEVRDMLIDTMVVCVPSDVWIEAMGDDLVPGGAGDGVDLACVDELFSDPAFLRPFLTAAIAGDLDIDDPTPATVDLFTRVIGCVSFGAAVAAEAAADGIELSEPTIACLDEAFADPEVIEMLLVDDSMADDVLGEMVFGCLSDDEFAELLGS